MNENKWANGQHYVLLEYAAGRLQPQLCYQCRMQHGKQGGYMHEFAVGYSTSGEGRA